MATGGTGERTSPSNKDAEDDPEYHWYADYTLPLVITPTRKAPPRGTVIFLHGAGDSGRGVAQWVTSSLGKPLRFTHLKVVYPSASLRPYTSAGGQDCRVWFDFPKGIKFDVPEDLAGINVSAATVNAIIEKEIQEGIPPGRIILGGLSQGGILALHVGLSLKQTIAGIFVLSSYLPKEAHLLNSLQSRRAEELPRVPIYMAHGSLDSLIRPEWGKTTWNRLQGLGMTASYKEYPGLDHALCQEEILDLKSWIKERVPSEKCLDILWQRGGNASNSSTALVLVGETCEYMGVLTDSMEQRILDADLQKYGIHYDHCVTYPGVQTPTSIILSNIQNASRTILAHQRKLPELTLDDFKKLPLHENIYKWIHFEGRPSADVIKTMLDHVDEFNGSNPDNRIVTSVEIEKLRENLECLFEAADVVFISKEYAQNHGCHTMEEAVGRMHAKCRPGATLICPWGDLGAAAKLADGRIVTSSAFPPTALVDTLAAGDTFNACTIASLSNGCSVQDAITFGCHVAGLKCGMRGWNGMMDEITALKTRLKMNK